MVIHSRAPKPGLRPLVKIQLAPLVNFELASTAEIRTKRMSAAQKRDFCSQLRTTYP
ncbi:hypothetical protein ACUXQ2_006427 [Cupriavidus metallidurans]